MNSRDENKSTREQEHKRTREHENRRTREQEKEEEEKKPIYSLEIVLKSSSLPKLAKFTPVS